MTETVGQEQTQDMVTFNDEMKEVLMQLTKEYQVRKIVAEVEDGEVKVKAVIENKWFKKLFGKSYLTHLQKLSDKICNNERKITVFLT